MKDISNKSVLRILSSVHACEEACTWVKEHGGSAYKLWQDCERGDWMAWIVSGYEKAFGSDRRKLVGALADCAALSLKYYEKQYPDDKRVRECIAVCRKYAKGKATDKELKATAHTAYAATYAAYTSAHLSSFLLVL